MHTGTPLKKDGQADIRINIVCLQPKPKQREGRGMQAFYLEVNHSKFSFSPPLGGELGIHARWTL
jgi:hypothetical protein